MGGDVVLHVRRAGGTCQQQGIVTCTEDGKDHRSHTMLTVTAGADAPSCRSLLEHGIKPARKQQGPSQMLIPLPPRQGFIELHVAKRVSCIYTLWGGVPVPPPPYGGTSSMTRGCHLVGSIRV